MPKFRNRPEQSRIERMPSPATRCKALRQARTAKSISPEEYRQHRDFYLGLVFLDGRASNFITCRLWAGLWLPLGLEKGKG